MMTPLRTLAVTVALGIPSVAMAAGQGTPFPAGLYRGGQPIVLSSPPEEPKASGPGEDAIIAVYRRAYRDLKRPRIAIYWNRTLTDRISQWFQPKRIKSTGEVELNFRVPEGPLKGTGRGSRNLGLEHLRTDPIRAGMRERVAMEFQDGFYGPLLETGTRLIDRAAILRLERNDLPNRLQRDTAPDIQALETEALKDYADLLLEVLLIADRKTPTGFAFRILVKRIRNGQIVASRFTRGIIAEDDDDKDPPKGELKPGPGGFYRVPVERKKIEPKDIGRQLAIETMQILSSLPAS